MAYAFYFSHPTPGWSNDVSRKRRTGAIGRGGLAKHLGEALDRFSDNNPFVFATASHPRISMSYLKQWLHRVGSGLRGDRYPPTVRSELRHGPYSYRPVFAEFHQRLSKGDSLADAARDAGEFFPAMVVEMIHVGEFTGKLDEVMLRLADHYEHMLSLRRTFIMGIAWPALQFVMAIFVVGLLIWAVGIFTPAGSVAPNDFGFGSGTQGLFYYTCFVVTILSLVAGAIIAVRRGWLGPAGWLLALKIPLLGKCIETMVLLG